MNSEGAEVIIDVTVASVSWQSCPGSGLTSTREEEVLCICMHPPHSSTPVFAVAPGLRDMELRGMQAGDFPVFLLVLCGALA